METKIVKIRNKVIGGGNPILIQSMTNTKTENVADTVAPVSYTHLDVYKRQHMDSKDNELARQQTITFYQGMYRTISMFMDF